MLIDNNDFDVGGRMDSIAPEPKTVRRGVKTSSKLFQNFHDEDVRPHTQ